jgi:ankyrin repeat protein
MLILGCILLLFSSCNTSSGSKSEGKAELQKEEIATPVMDLHTAAVIGDLDVIRQHIAAGTDLDLREPTVGSSPLITASVFGKTEVARTLVEAGADVNLQNNEGSTALHVAAFLCRTEIVKILLENGADRDLVNIYGSTPLQSVAGPFSEVEAIYDEFSRNLGPLGFKLDYEKLEQDRPVVADMLR